MKSRRMKRPKRTKRTKSTKRTKRGAGLFGPNKCGEMNPSKTYSDNRRNCLNNKDKWTSSGFKINGVYDITCKRQQVESLNFPSNPDCKNDIKDREFDPTAADDQYDGTHGLMF